MRKKIGLIIILILIVIIAFAGYRYIHYRTIYAVTDAVFVESDSLTNLAFQLVGGKLIKMPYDEGDRIKKGALLAEVDPTELKTAKKEVIFSLHALQNKRNAAISTLSRVSEQMLINIKIAKLSISSTNFQILSSLDMLKSRQDLLNKTHRDYMRAKRLYIHNVISKVRYQDAKTVLDSSENAILSLRNKIKSLKLSLPISIKKYQAAISERKRVGELKDQVNALGNDIKATKEKIKSINYRISQSRLISPINGIIAKKYQSIGSVVGPGTFVYSITNPKSLYIYALLEETKLNGIHIGNPVNIKIDAYPNKKYEGVVESILPTTAAKFSLVPRDIAAGEFTKVIQRVGVRIKFSSNNLSGLKVGLSGEVAIKRSK